MSHGSGGTGEAPALTVVVTTFAGVPYLTRCLRALLDGRGADRLEILVPLDDTVDSASDLVEQFPEVRFVPMVGVRTPAERRAACVAMANAPLVALTEDHCIPTPNWAEQIIAEHEAPYAAIGGVLDKIESGDGRDSGYSWALYLSDWGRYMPPVEEGPVDYLTDCNVSYKRSVLEPLRHLWEEEFHETTVNWELQDRGETLWLTPRIVALQQRSLTLGEAVWDRYNFGRLFASTRVVSTPPWKRALFAIGAMVLPLLLTARVVSIVWRKGRARGALLRSLPALAVTTSVWAVGEATGYLTGTAPGALAPD